MSICFRHRSKLSKGYLFALSILIAGSPLETYELQRNDEISISVKVKNHKYWVISSEASKRGTFNDQWVMSVTHVGLQAMVARKE